MKTFFTIGHRGMGPNRTSDDPDLLTCAFAENSLPSFQHVFSIGGDGTEFDVHKTKDDKIVVIHDNELNKKVYHANRIGQDLGLVSDHTREELNQYDIGHGQRIPELTDVLDLIVEENAQRAIAGQQPLMVNIELKGQDVVKKTYEIVADYIDQGKLRKDDFVFNSFIWDRLKELKSYDPEIKIVPAIRTIDLFGVDNVSMPGYIVPKDTNYQREGLQAIQAFHEDVGCHAFDCIIFDLKPEFISYCNKNKIGLFTSTSHNAVKACNIKEQLALMLDASQELPIVCFRADNVTDTNNILDEIVQEKKHITQINHPEHAQPSPAFLVQA